MVRHCYTTKISMRGETGGFEVPVEETQDEGAEVALFGLQVENVGRAWDKDKLVFDAGLLKHVGKALGLLRIYGGIGGAVEEQHRR